MDINRGLIIVRPRQPYVDWANSFDGAAQETIESLSDDSNSYLVPSWYDEPDFTRVLKRVFKAIFENELAAWMTDPSTWPSQRGFKTFLEWFEIEPHSMVFELGDGAILVEDGETYN